MMSTRTSARIELTPYRIVRWADAHHRRTGRWPRILSGRVREAPQLTWRRLDAALREGYHGLPGGSSLATLLARERSVRNRARPGRLTVKQILLWAEAQFARTGKWPSCNSGPIADAPGENWQSIQNALYLGLRGLPGGSSVAHLLETKKRKRNRKNLPPFRLDQILAWAQSRSDREGDWPTMNSGPVREAPAETWKAVHGALAHGLRGLPGDMTLAGVIRLYRNVLLRAHHETPLSDGQRSGGTAIDVTVRILTRSRAGLPDA
jgi:hypothetical protein